MNATEHPRQGDVYEGKYGREKGKRIRLIKFYDSPVYLGKWFATQTIAHPSSPRMVGHTGHVKLYSIKERWRLVESGGSNA